MPAISKPRSFPCPATALIALTCLATVVGLAGTPAVDFAAQIQPILSKKCYSCHGPDESSRKGKLRLDSFIEATRQRAPRPAIQPGQPEGSEVSHRIHTSDPEDIMPPPEAKNPLTAGEVNLLTQWIAQGADYSPHWAWISPRRPELPAVPWTAWSKSGVDRLIGVKLEESGLEPSPRADRYTLIRRLSLDLTGLPPTPEQVRDFVDDRRPDAYERWVDQLLASPHFGERWARMWLDLGRYADSAGYGSDPLRPNIWPWRDWLIRALNDNLPFDEFTQDLIAGDLVEGATDDQKVATAFHRNTMTNTEGGTDDEEWRVAAVKDRAAVTAQVWMGLTLNCAQCHTHKFDPITQREYYSFYALFNQTGDTDQPDERPTLAVYSDRELRERAELERRIAQHDLEYRAPNAAFDTELKEWAVQSSRPISWMPLAPDAASSGSTNGPALTVLEDRSIRVAGPSPDRETYLVSGTASLPKVTAVRLEVLPDPELPRNGPGRAPNGAFVLNDLRLELIPDRAVSIPVRFIRVEAPGENRILSLAEVQVFSGGTNVALRGTPSQSSTDYLGDANRAIDGNTDGNYGESRSTTHTRMEKDPWWELDLGAEIQVEQVAVWNRTDGGVGSRLAGSRLVLLDSARKPVWQGAMDKAPDPVVNLGPSAPRALRLANASADHSVTDFPPARVVDSDAGRGSGWSTGNGDGRAHQWVAELAEPLELQGQARFRISLAQNYGEQRTLGRFRVSLTDRPSPIRVFPPEVAAALQVPPAQWTDGQREVLDAFYRPESRALGGLYRQINDLKAEQASIRGTPVPVMQELAQKGQRTTRFLNKGNFLDPGDVVAPGVPVAFNAWPDGAPTNRLGLARWLTAPENPLTARVMVNRVWGQLMGQPIVETEEDFGTQGSLPTNRPLLDWLAVSFATLRDSASVGWDPLNPRLRWDFKALVRLIVTSEAYRQSSALTADRREKDPQNKLYSRAARKRLDAETVRDQALAISGLLSRKIGGPSVYPMQPDGLWRAAFNGERSWATSDGEDRYRRGIYTFWRRTVPYPSMATFDAPSRESCTLRRQPTNTPLQAFVTLNDPVFVECAQSLGRALAQEPGSVADRVRRGLERVLARPAPAKSVEELVQLHDSERVHYRSRTEEALQLAENPLGPLPGGLEPSEAAAWTTVANVLLNLDGVLSRN